MNKYFNGDYLGDCLIMTDILNQVDFYAGTERKKMLGHGPTKGDGSMLFGTTWRGYLSPTKSRTKDEETGLYRTKVYDLHPELKDIFREFANYHFPEFQYTQVQMNRNFPCPPHFDSKNIGESVLCVFGEELQGGRMCYLDKNTNKIVKIDATEKPFLFNGSNTLHWVEHWTGRRYSLVFFTNHRKSNPK